MLHVRGTSLKRSKHQTRQEYLDISKPKLTFYSLNLSLPWQSQQQPCAIKYGGQTWLDEPWLMAEKHSHRSLIRCKKIVCIYVETVKQEEGIVHNRLSKATEIYTSNAECYRRSLKQAPKCEKHVGKGTTLRMTNSYPRSLGQTGQPAEKNSPENENANRFSNSIIWW